MLHRIHPDDTVAVTLRALPSGTQAEVGGRAVLVGEDVPAGHKVALAPHAPGSEVVKYGFPIGRATAPIAPGRHVHTHNLATSLEGEEAYRYTPAPPPPPVRDDGRTFEGYRRADERVGTRNEVWVLNTVGCVNRAAERVAREAHRRWGPEGEGVVDGVYSFGHPYGCSQLGGDLDSTRSILAGLVRHPNAGGVLVLALGCENNGLDALLDAAGRQDGRVRALTAQHVFDEVEDGLAAVGDLVGAMREDRRTTVPARELVLGFKCGGSDGLSGVTANPLVGRVADKLAALGGRGLLTEVPEMFGAERVLFARAVSEGVFDEAVSLVNRFKRYFLDHGQPVYENPSPGNKEGGLTTLEEKSLGAIQKGGRAPVAEILPYGGRASVPSDAGFVPGLALLDAPGNDGVSSTALTAAGATLLLFTTGRGTPLGFPAPTVKIASNNRLTGIKLHWIDASAEGLLTDPSPDAFADRFFDRLLRYASGEPTLNEQHDYREIALWKRGVTL